MLLGVMARDAGDRERAIDCLRKAHEMAPQAPNPALELGFTLEAKHPREARKVYEQILAHDPASRPAMLGLARVARSQNRLDEARALYERLLAVNPKDPDALNGMAWLALAERNREQARAGFEHVLAIAPDNEEAKIGLSKAPDVYRYLLDTSATLVSTAQGTSWGFGARGMAGITPYDTLELGGTISPTSCRRCRRSASPPCRQTTSPWATIGLCRSATPSTWSTTIAVIPPADRALDRGQRRLLSHRLAALVRRLSPGFRRLPVRWPPVPDRAQRNVSRPPGK